LGLHRFSIVRALRSIGHRQRQELGDAYLLCRG
jgi:hypothetical protein